MANTINKIIRNGTEYVIKDTTYTAGTGISIDSNNVISNTQTSAEWWNITGTLSDQTDLNTALGNKQDNLTLPSSPTQWHLVTWWANNETLVDGWAVPTGVPAVWSNGQVLTVVSWAAAWANAPATWIQLAPNSPLQPPYHWYGTEAQYQALSQYYTDTPWDTVYYTV